MLPKPPTKPAETDSLSPILLPKAYLHHHPYDNTIAYSCTENDTVALAGTKRAADHLSDLESDAPAVGTAHKPRRTKRSGKERCKTQNQHAPNRQNDVIELSDDDNKVESHISGKQAARKDAECGGGTPVNSIEKADEGQEEPVVSNAKVAGEDRKSDGGMRINSAEMLPQINELLDEARIKQIERGMRPNPFSKIRGPTPPLALDGCVGHDVHFKGELCDCEMLRKESRAKLQEMYAARKVITAEENAKPVITKLGAVLETYDDYVVKEEVERKALRQAKDKIRELEAENEQLKAKLTPPTRDPEQPIYLTELRNESKAKDELLAKERTAKEECLSAMHEQLKAKDKQIVAIERTDEEDCSSAMREELEAKDKQIATMEKLSKEREEYMDKTIKAKEGQNQGYRASAQRIFKKKDATIAERDGTIMARMRLIGQLNESRRRILGGK